MKGRKGGGGGGGVGGGPAHDWGSDTAPGLTTFSSIKSTSPQSNCRLNI